MSTKAELESEIVALRVQIADLQDAVREMDALLAQKDETYAAAEDAYKEAAGLVGDLLISNRLLQRRLAEHSHPPEVRTDAPSLTAKEAQELGLA